jgi:uncharacterized protein YndB with AHSA1/START domain
MSHECVSATRAISAAPEVVFAVLADPSRHAAIDGTGWVCSSVGEDRLTAAGQVFRMAMYHPDHPDGGYQTANRVTVVDPPRVIAWETGYDADDGSLRFGGWVWRYDLVATAPDCTEVTLTYDWSAVSESVREHLTFPPFPSDHLDNSLAHLAELVSS